MNLNIKIDRSPNCCPEWLETDLQTIIDAWIVRDLKNIEWSECNPHKPSKEAVRRYVFKDVKLIKDLIDIYGFGDTVTDRVKEMSLEVLSSFSLMNLNYHWCDVNCEIYITVKDKEIIIKYVDTRDAKTEYDNKTLSDRCPLVIALIDFISNVGNYDLEQISKNKPCCSSVILEPIEQSSDIDFTNLPEIDVRQIYC